MAGLASRLAQRWHAVCLITLDDGGRDRYSVDPSVTRHRLNVMGSDGAGLWQRGKAVLRRRRAVRQAILVERPDVVLSFCDRTNLLVLAATGGIRSRAGSLLPIVVAERSDPGRQKLGTLGEWLRRRLYPRAALVVALTESSASQLRVVGCRRVEVIPSAVDAPPIRSDRIHAALTHRIVAVGRLEPEKGFDRLIEAFAGIAAGFPGWSLAIFGEGSERQRLESQVETAGLADRVSMPGWVQPIWEELALATLYVLSSRYEGFPSALLEAMAVGVPCIAVDCDSGPRAIIRSGTDGLLVEDSVIGLAEGLRQMMQDPQTRERFAEQALEVCERFSWDQMVPAHERALKRVVRPT